MMLLIKVENASYACLYMIAVLWLIWELSFFCSSFRSSCLSHWSEWDSWPSAPPFPVQRGQWVNQDTYITIKVLCRLCTSKEITDSQREFLQLSFVVLCSWEELKMISYKIKFIIDEKLSLSVSCIWWRKCMQILFEEKPNNKHTSKLINVQPV